MDKIHIMERINEYAGKNVHVYTHEGKFFTGQLNTDWFFSNLRTRRVLEIGWKQDRVEIPSIESIVLV
jgi:hypothetical protein